MSTAPIDNFHAQPLAEEVARGQEFAFYNLVGGDRGEVTNAGGEVAWSPRQVRAEVVQNGGLAGIFESVNHPMQEGLPLDFNALLPPQIRPPFQHRAAALAIELADGRGPFRAELKSPANQVLWTSPAITLTGGRRELVLPLPNPAPANVQTINLVVEGADNDFFVVERIALETDGADLGPQEPFVWTYANLLANYDPATGRVRDRANAPSGASDNVSATGGFALATVLAARRGVISLPAAATIVENITDSVLALPRFHGLLPHFVTGKTNPAIAPNTEWASLDTVLTYTPILLARQLLGLPTGQVEQAMAEIDWDDLTLDNGTISHGYSYSQERLNFGWDTFGGETFLAVWAKAASRPAQPPANVPFPNPPTFNGAGFIDELAALYLPLPTIDIWGNNLPAYRAQAARRQVEHYAGVTICCASAGEVPEPWTATDHPVYQNFGIGGRIPDNDGTELLGRLVATPHHAAMIASLEPAKAMETWSFLKAQEAVSPLNAVESVYVATESGEPQAVWNPLKGSWNLLLAALGYERALSGDPQYLPYQAAAANAFVANGLDRLTITTDITLSNNLLPENADTAAGPAAVGQLTATDVDPDAAPVFTLAVGDGANDRDNGSFQIADNVLQVKQGTTLDFETQAAYQILVQASDGIAHFTQALAVRLTDVNEPPTAVTLSNKELAENTDTASGPVDVGQLAAADEDANSMHVFSLATGDGANDKDNALFQIAGAALQVKQGVVLDFESQASYSILIQVDDGKNQLVQPTVVNVTDVNEPPTDIALSKESIAENANTSAGPVNVGQLTAMDPDADAKHAYTLVAGAGDTDNARFQIAGGTLQVKQGAALDFETRPTLSIRIQATDGLNTFSKAFTIQVTDGPEPWRNARLPEDVNDRDGVTLADLLLIVQALRDAGGPHPLPIPPTAERFPPPYLDVDGDNHAALSDLLLVVQHLRNQIASAPAPEGEGATFSTAQPAYRLRRDQRAERRSWSIRFAADPSTLRPSRALCAGA